MKLALIAGLLLAIACRKLGIAGSSVTASGQLPSRWLNAESLEVTVRLTTRGGRKFTTPVAVRVANDGNVSLR